MLISVLLCCLGKVYGDRTLHLAWYNQGTPERDVGGPEHEEEAGLPDDDYTPLQHDYLPPGLQEHEDSLSQVGYLPL
jgi:hypothetical protein